MYSSVKTEETAGIVPTVEKVLNEKEMVLGRNWNKLSDGLILDL